MIIMKKKVVVLYNKAEQKQIRKATELIEKVCRYS